MTDRLLILVFPFIPLGLMAGAALAHTLVRRDLSRPALILNILLQASVGALLVVRFYGRADGLTVALTPLDYSIVFRFDQYKAYFMVAYLTPLLFSALRLRQLESFHLRMLYFFFLGGCSGLIVTGDAFNFFVFYELMIMAAYVLVASRRMFYASVKYMLFSAISSVLLLAGIIVLYDSTARFGFDALAMVRGGRFLWMMLFFCLAFMVKGAFFPVSAWVATCHAAAVSLVSAFLASFTIFSGIYGLFYFVIQPAAVVLAPAVETFLLWISLATVLLPSLFVLLEPDLKRCVAGSTVYTIGFVGLLLVHRFYDAALLYMVIHALYKSLMFYLLDELEWTPQMVAGRLPVLIAGAVCVVFAAGWFPSFVFFVKYPILEQHALYRVILGIAAWCIAGGFFKFAWRVLPGWGGVVLPSLVAIALLGYRPLFSQLAKPTFWAIAFDLILLVAVALGAPQLYRRLQPFAGLDRRHVFTNLNVELFGVLLLVAAGTIVFFNPIAR